VAANAVDLECSRFGEAPKRRPGDNSPEHHEGSEESERDEDECHCGPLRRDHSEHHPNRDGHKYDLGSLAKARWILPGSEDYEPPTAETYGEGPQRRGEATQVEPMTVDGPPDRDENEDYRAV
jgi:hypothetical protein